MGQHPRRVRDRRQGAGPNEKGQGLVEFALTLPIFVLLLMGVLEFGFLYNSILTIQFASRQGVSAAAQAGAIDGADCAILRAVERALTTPIDKSRISAVEIFQSDASGGVTPGRINRYVRSGVLSCDSGPDEPYSLVGTEGYPQVDRHDALAETLDVIGVRIEYTYAGFTPVGAGRTWVVSDGATLRMEPKQ